MAKTKIMLLGDSIRLGYQEKVKEKLGEDFEVYTPEENCRFTRYCTFNLHDYLLSCPDPVLIHFNCGLWDAQYRYEGKGSFTPALRYAEDLQTLAALLLEVTPRVIFATTTPVNDQNPEQHNDTISHFNALAVPVMQKMGIAIDDLHTVVKADIPRYICDDLTHLSEDGKEACANAVVASILNMLKKEI